MKRPNTISMNYREPLKLRIYKKLALGVAFTMIFQAIAPTAVWALTSGPAQPEFASFEPVTTTSMVNEFTGDFTYNIPIINIPGPDGSDYPLSLSYHSGASPEEEASWVGYGWTLNPGAIMRGKRGFPDDYKDAKVTYWNKTKPNRTVSIGATTGPELFSIGDLVSANSALRYNNYKGFGYSVGANLSLPGVSLGYGISDGRGSWSAQINPLDLLSKVLYEKAQKNDHPAINEAESYTAKGKDGKTVLASRKANEKDARRHGRGTSGFGQFSFAQSQYTAPATPYTGFSANLDVALLPTLFSPLQLGTYGSISGNYTQQKNVEQTTLNAQGYLYNGSNTISSYDVLDYYVEKDQPYQKRNTFLGIPFSNADNFAVTGEGIGGGFRLYNKHAGHYRPNVMESNMPFLNFSLEVEAGQDIGGGTDIPVIGFSTHDVGAWSSPSSFADSTIDDNVFFRYNNDLGGSVEFGHEARQQARLKKGTGEKFDPSIEGIITQMNGGKRSKRAGYIAYNTNREMLETVNGKTLKTYTRNGAIRAMVNRNNMSTGLKSQIGEIATFNEAGVNYVYGLPSYSRNELSLQYDLKGVGAASIKNNYLAYRDISDDDLETKVGEERNTPYATSFLLTQITQPNYVDKTLNGPSDDDFGGWVKFAYDRVHGGADKEENSGTWYRWRIPYTGLLYNKGELSTQDDDLGTVLYGEKEIYYLDTIETRTHFAKFITSDRTDGHGAASNFAAANNSEISSSTDKLKKLDAIELYAKKGGSTKLLQTVHFEYAKSGHELCRNLPNATNNRGKLTLKKVWVEYQGVVNARISPYVFDYKYPDTNYPPPYDSLENYGGFDTTAQNPDYSYFNLDAWGNYQYKGQNRFDSLITWLDQTPSNKFDPAAWQLKRIQLPTGGEIHVQYEQDDYAYVQDREVMAMIPLKSANMNDEKYVLDVSVLGINEGNPSDAELIKLRKKINDHYVGKANKKMYFKFLYQLAGDNTPDLSSCASEYISGYTNIKSCQIDDITGELYVTLDNSSGCEMGLPKKVCKDYVQTQRAGKLDAKGNCNAAEIGIDKGAKPQEVASQFVTWLGAFTIPGNLCSEMNPGLSYFRVPMVHAKRGGGIRVKRILSYDEGIENGGFAHSGGASLYGTEFDYTTTDDAGNVISSGVATTEPGSIREENALVDYISRSNPKSNFICKVIAGRDKAQQEGFLGESVLPAPAIGYSKVTAKSIHTGKTSNGVNVKEFFTVKDAPLKVEPTAIKGGKKWLQLPLLLVNTNTSKIFQTQGYSIVQHEMHGNPKSDITYNTHPDNPNAVESSSTIYEYFDTGNKIPVVGKDGGIAFTNPGKDMEVVFESKAVVEKSRNLRAEFDVSVGFFGPLVPIPQLSILPYFSESTSGKYTHVTTKITRYPAILKKTITTRDGIRHTEEILALHPETGKPALVQNTDGYHDEGDNLSTDHNGAYQTLTYAASQQYPEMGQKARNDKKLFKTDPGNLTITKLDKGGGVNSIKLTGSGAAEALKHLYPGDLVQLKDSNNIDYGVFYLTDSMITLSEILLEKTAHFGNNTSSKTGISIAVIKSGRTNQLLTNTGSVTNYGHSYTFDSLQNKATVHYRDVSYDNDKHPVFSNFYAPTGVVSAAANTFSDDWSYDTLVFGSPSSGVSTYDDGTRGKWRVASSHDYRADITSANGSANRTYTGGTLNAFTTFDWDTPVNNDSITWLRNSLVTKYSPYGQAIEEQNTTGIYSAALYGYNNSVPYMVAANAEENTIAFESFERNYENGNYFQAVLEKKHSPYWGGYFNGVNDTYAHAGNYSWRIPMSNPAWHHFYFPMTPIVLNDKTLDQGVQVDVWVYDEIGTEKCPIWGYVTSQSDDTINYSYESIARTGEWELFRSRIDNLTDNFSINDTLTFWVNSNYDEYTYGIYLDDIRIKPIDATATTYVFDPDHRRLVTTFDDNHFGTYYIYNAEGKLVRKEIETERGKIMVNETLQNTKMEARTAN